MENKFVKKAGHIVDTQNQIPNGWPAIFIFSAAFMWCLFASLFWTNTSFWRLYLVDHPVWVGLTAYWAIFRFSLDKTSFFSRHKLSPIIMAFSLAPLFSLKPFLYFLNNNLSSQWSQIDTLAYNFSHSGQIYWLLPICQFMIAKNIAPGISRAAAHSIIGLGIFNSIIPLPAIVLSNMAANVLKFF